MRPEERVRQALIQELVVRGFPRELIVIEKEIGELVSVSNAPKRRVDVLCFMKKGDALLPLLMVECKAVPLSRKALEQVLGYNYYVDAPFVAIANAQGMVIVDRKGNEHVLQSYTELVRCASDACVPIASCEQ